MLAWMPEEMARAPEAPRRFHLRSSCLREEEWLGSARMEPSILATWNWKSLLSNFMTFTVFHLSLAFLSFAFSFLSFYLLDRGRWS